MDDALDRIVPDFSFSRRELREAWCVLEATFGVNTEAVLRKLCRRSVGLRWPDITSCARDLVAYAELVRNA